MQDEILQRGDGTTIKSEELWDGHPGGPQPFATLAISQMPAWYDLVLLHVQVANVLYMMACLNLKMLKPLNNLFESVVSKARDLVREYTNTYTYMNVFVRYICVGTALSLSRHNG